MNLVMQFYLIEKNSNLERKNILFPMILRRKEQLLHFLPDLFQLGLFGVFWGYYGMSSVTFE